MKTLFSPSNHLFVLARQARRLPPVWAAVILSFLFIIGAGILGGIPAFVFGAIVGGLPISDTILQAALQQFLLLFFSFAPIYFIIWLWVSLYEKRPFWTLGLENKRAAPKFVRGFLIGIFLFSIVVGVLSVLGNLTAQADKVPIQGLPALAGILIMGMGWLVQGPAEEVLCRGWLMPVIGARYKPWLGVVLSAVIFAVYHSLNPNLVPLAVINLILFGLFTALFALFDESIWGVAGLHAAWNWAQGNIFGLPVSGMEPGGGTLISLGLRGPDWFTGGAFGPEAGAVVTLLLLISILVTGSLLFRRNQFVSRESGLPV